MKTRKRVNISVDKEAYAILRSRKRPGDTWSDVIKANVYPPLAGDELVDELKRIYRRAKPARRHQLAHPA